MADLSSLSTETIALVATGLGTFAALAGGWALIKYQTSEMKGQLKELRTTVDSNHEYVLRTYVPSDDIKGMVTSLKEGIDAVRTLLNQMLLADRTGRRRDD